MRVLFVCLGNICRSPMAEGVFRRMVADRNLQATFEIDSAGTSAYHLGDLADARMRRTAEQHGITLLHRARRATAADLRDFDLIVAMDRENLAELRRLPGADAHADKIVLMRDYDPTPDDGQVPDPYFGGERGFEEVYQLLRRSCAALLDELSDTTSITPDA
ncbi:MAG: low molecular weight protein-tyrosine-phosphatase [Catalinimonas sp.]